MIALNLNGSSLAKMRLAASISSAQPKKALPTKLDDITILMRGCSKATQ
jgi:hypothetical protein